MIRWFCIEHNKMIMQVALAYMGDRSTLSELMGDGSVLAHHVLSLRITQQTTRLDKLIKT